MDGTHEIHFRNIIGTVAIERHDDNCQFLQLGRLHLSGFPSAATYLKKRRSPKTVLKIMSNCEVDSSNDYLNVLNDARSSLVKYSGCSHAAKCVPLGSRL